MAFYQDGKAVFAKAMGELVEKEPLDSITVNDIVEKASASRTTFYRYFKDKNDLLAYVYTKMASDLIEHAERTHLSNYGLALDIIKYIQSRPGFLKKLLLTVDKILFSIPTVTTHMRFGFVV